MENQEQAFYFSKTRMFVGLIFLFVILAFFAMVTIFIIRDGQVQEEGVLFVVMLITSVLLCVFVGAGLLKLFRPYPYLLITEDAIRIDPFTKSEANILLDDIAYLKVSEFSFQKIVEIVLYNEAYHFSQLSLFNKIRLGLNRMTGHSVFMINIKVVRKNQRDALFVALDYLIQQKYEAEQSLGAEETSVTTEKTTEVVGQEEFIEKYDPTPPVDRTIDRTYFLKAYGYSLFIFALSFILFYWLITKSSGYLVYIMVSLLLFPFAKGLIDSIFGFSLRHKIDKQKGVTYYFDQLLFMFDVLLFHSSVFIGPVGILFLLIRFFVIRIKREH